MSSIQFFVEIGLALQSPFIMFNLCTEINLIAIFYCACGDARYGDEKLEVETIPTTPDGEEKEVCCCR